jgi:hypothetical protein
MTDRPPAFPDPGSPHPEPTRDVRLPRVPGHPPVAVPPDRAGGQATGPAAPDVRPPPPEPSSAIAPTAAPGASSIADQPTDRLAAPEAPARQPTAAFGPPPPDPSRPDVGRPPFGGPGQPDSPVQAPPGAGPLPSSRAGAGHESSDPTPMPQPQPPRDGGRKSTWVVLVLLPVLVIVGAALLLFRVLNGG